MRQINYREDKTFSVEFGTFMKPSSELIAAQQNIICPATWIQNAMAIDARGCSIDPHDRRAVCFCSLGATQQSKMPKNALMFLGQAVPGMEDETDMNTLVNAIATFNDTHSHEEVMALWGRAIKTATLAGQ